ncbi:N-acetyltransferase [Ktedonosporobacter rubrisoli]|uniref:N-acetyltransferase n=1 Tax=Ktedonosporobacter rubrisoli TaxID=2509675 RepID=A0A4P6JKK3_KTERU|nr:GNAT family N-acetyltransferase [Ktedonosporobacter rubrisoli]QBD75510.1 N-acetyltransferase [Ktedonosporobacter rubrisoli]
MKEAVTPTIRLRDVMMSDLPIFFEQQLDPQAIYMAAFTPKDPADKEAFTARWNRNLANEANIIQTILYADEVAGSISIYENEKGHSEVTYWLGKPYWGKGIASAALAILLKRIAVRPVYGRAIKDNLASLRVLEKAGFVRIGEDRGFANARNQEVEEFILRLD